MSKPVEYPLSKMSEPVDEAALHELVAVLAHDINNPLAALVTNLSFVDGALTPLLSEDAVEALSDARLLCDVLARLVSNLDLLARKTGSERGKTPLDLLVYASQSISRLAPEARASEVSLALHPKPPEGEAFVIAERDMLTRAIENLIAFAMERASRGTSIELQAERTKEGAHLIVRFSARPIEVSPLPAGATPAARRRWIQEQHGRGLVLYCARLAAALFGGQVLVSTEPDGRVALSLVASASEQG